MPMQGWAMSQRTNKKYPNRRLYDTARRRYVTLSDIRSLVLDHIDFVIVDHKNQSDITRRTLLQVLAEYEAADDPILSLEALIRMIRSSGRS
jgi:polyhydroxyalkanoate synthesis repressor PhaR